MGPPIAVLGSYHICPGRTGKTSHVGGPTLATAANVVAGGLPVACVGDKLVCKGPPDTIVAGSASVTANGKPVARIGDPTAHGGKIVEGNPTVLVGG
jgi:uncharacterized Zn-binding protein involved in type VI secretion